MGPVKDRTKDNSQTHNPGNLKTLTEPGITVGILTTSDRRALFKANGLRALSSSSSSCHTSTPITTSPTMNTRGQSVIEPRHRRRANNDLAPSKMDARSGPLGVTIANVHAAVKHAYDSGGRCLKYRARDRIILEREFKGLGGCSRYVYDAILSPLLNVLAMLKDIGDALENWAFRVKRMHSQRGVLRMYHFPYQHIYSSLARDHLALQS